MPGEPSDTVNPPEDGDSSGVTNGVEGDESDKEIIYETVIKLSPYMQTKSNRFA